MVEPQRPVVVTDSGSVGGLRKDQVAAFLGIPYAASPIGALRFAAPEAHAGWTTVLDASHPGPSVPQAPRMRSTRISVLGNSPRDGNEDGCLNLNVWTPADALTDGRLRPVLVFIHGGGFSGGAGGWPWYHGSNLCALGDIVVVTINYRLGALGYLYLPEIGADNLGPQDQGAALRWIRNNISAFGGDPHTVTVSGQSAGAYSTAALAADPATSGLFQRLLLQSPPLALAPQDPADAVEMAAEYTRLLGVDTASDLGSALRALPVEQLLIAFSTLAVQHVGPVGDWRPPLMPVLGGAGMPCTWQQAMTNGAFDSKDFMAGSNGTENTALWQMSNNTAVQKFTREDALCLLPGLAPPTDSYAEACNVEAIYNQYSARLPGRTPGQVFTAITGDWTYRDAIVAIAGHRTTLGHHSYIYQFLRAPRPDPDDLGSTHCAELPFVTGNFEASIDAPMLGSIDDGDRELSRALAGAVVQFVKTGSPNGPGLVNWPSYGSASAPLMLTFDSSRISVAEAY